MFQDDTGRDAVLQLRRLTFELRGRQRQDARARAEKMYTVPRPGPWRPAVGAPLERGVRHQLAGQADQSGFACR